MDKENPKKDGDEEGESKKDFQDPAIISAISGGITTELPPQSLIEHRYSKEELLKLRKAPHSQKKPKFLDAAYYNSAGVWDPEPWHYSNKQAENQAEGGGASGGQDDPAPSGKQRSRPSDPRERIRKEQDGIVLSPQRRSFNSGCFVPNSRETANTAVVPGAALPLRANRAHSPLGTGGGKGERERERERDRDRDRDQPMQRRIGSGRILPWDYQEKNEENDFGYRREIGERDRGGGDRRDRGDRPERERRNDERERRIDDRDRERDDRFERRSFGRDYDPAKEKHGRQSQSRGFGRRVSNESREEEPEWFSSGPISQNDTIELRGFDDPPEKAKKNNNKQNKRSVNGDAGGKKLDPPKKNASKESLIGKEPGSGGRSTPAKPHNDKAHQNEKEDEKTLITKVGDEDCFNFDAIFKADSLPIPGLLSNGVESGDAAGSRFSRWFQREKSPPTKEDANKRTSPHEQEHHHHNLIRNFLGDAFKEPQTVAIPQPGDAESYFAPISPATNTQHPPQAGRVPKHQETSLNMIEMQQRAAAGHAAKKADPPPESAKILSLEELEAPLRQGAPDKTAQNKPGEEDVQQFKRLFSQAMSKPMSIMEMLSHSQQKDAEATRFQQARMTNQVPQVQHMTEMAYKLQQLQQQQQQNQVQQRQQQFDILSKLFNPGNFAGAHQQRGSPLHEIAMAQSRELLNRPEAQAILQGMKRGDITPQHLYQQLANPAMQPRHREMLVTILKMQQPPPQQQQPQPQVPPPQPPQPAVVNVGPVQQQQQVQPPAVSPSFYSQQQLRVSPLTPNAYCVSPIMATSPNTLSVPALPQRIPSPRELQVHTQQIMQQALIKKKLEEQEENYRKKQQQQRGAGAGSPAKSTASPTPSHLFMPTSVMRKMTAEKDDSSKDGKLPQGRPLTGLRTGQPQVPQNPVRNMQLPPQQQQPQPLQQQPQPLQQPQPPTNWNNHFVAQMKQPGRAIVKANNYHPGQNQAEYFQQQQQAQQHRMLHQQHLPQQPQQQPKNFFSQPPPQQQPPQQQQQSGGQSQQFQQLSSQQLRQQHQNVRAQHQQQQPPTFPPGNNWQTATFDNNHHRGDLSPTSDQLARWFSPDLLERARKGNVPSIPTSAVAPHALSLEEIERQTTPVGQH